jgi:hypothetical protein
MRHFCTHELSTPVHAGQSFSGFCCGFTGIATKLCKRPEAKIHHNKRSSIITMPLTRRQQAAAAAHSKEMPPVSMKNQPKQKAAPKAAPKAAAKAAPTTAFIDLTLDDTTPPEKAYCASKTFPITTLASEKNQKRVTIDEHPETPLGYVAMLESRSKVGEPKQGKVCKGKCNC